MFAIIATGGKQLNVEVGKEYFIEKLEGKEKDKVIFDQVLMIQGKIGSPLIKGAQVHAEIIKQGKAKKIVVFKYKPKKNSKTKYGHRQPYTKVKITDILLDAKTTNKIKEKTVAEINSSDKKVTKVAKKENVKKQEPKTVKKATNSVVKKPVNKTSAVKPKVAKDTKKVTADQKNVKAIYDHKNLTVKIVEDNNSKKPKK